MSEQYEDRPSAKFYGPQYARMDSRVAAEIRLDVFGEDIGQGKLAHWR
jgi:hypothetical protein